MKTTVNALLGWMLLIAWACHPSIAGTSGCTPAQFPTWPASGA